MRTILRPIRGLGHEAGQAAVEFAGAMIPLTLVFLVIVDAGMIFAGWIQNTNAVREGARCGVVGGSDAAIVAKVGDPYGATDPATVVRADENADGKVGPGDSIKVTLQWEHRWVAPVNLFGFDRTTTKTSLSTMRLETDDFTTNPCN